MSGNQPTLKCRKCSGVGRKLVLVVDCHALRNGELFCLDHLQHYGYEKYCWLCLGSGKASRITVIWRYVRVWALRVVSARKSSATG
jgi:hypothetical protein